MHRYSVSAGTPQRMPCRNPVAEGRISGAIPIGSSACTAKVRNTHSSMPSISASHSACRNSGPMPSRRPAPSSCETEGGNAISVPIGTIIGSQNIAVPTATAASVLVPWRPAMTLSTKPIRPVAKWPATSGAARTAVARTSRRKRARSANRGMRREGKRIAGSRNGRWRQMRRGRILVPLAGRVPMHANDDATGTPDAVPAPQAGAVARGNCQNCGVPLLGDYCYACGQPVKGLVRHFSSFIGDVLDSVFEWDGRTPRTLWPLLAKPGYLTLEYLAGRRVRYVSPFRLFFFLAVITFFVGRFVVSFGDGEVNFAGNPAIANATTVEEVEQLRDE